MSSKRADRYLDVAGETDCESYRLAIEDMRWLVEHATEVSGMRLELLRALPTALPASDEPGLVGEEPIGELPVAELKELLTGLIIMQSRLQGREARLTALLQQAMEQDAPNAIFIEKAKLQVGIRSILDAAARIQSDTGTGE